jgi:protease I
MALEGRRIAILLAPRGTEDAEFAQPKAAVEKAGGTVTVIGIETGEARTNNNDLDPGETYSVESSASDASAEDFDALIVPGGCVGADTLRASDDVIGFVRSFFDQAKPVAVICHGPWLLVEAGVVDGRTLTSYPTLETDIVNAGGVWVDQEVMVDQGLVTSRNPKDLPAFCAKLVEEFEEGRHPAQAQSD